MNKYMVCEKCIRINPPKFERLFIHKTNSFMVLETIAKKAFKKKLKKHGYEMHEEDGIWVKKSEEYCVEICVWPSDNPEGHGRTGDAFYNFYVKPIGE